MSQSLIRTLYQSTRTLRTVVKDAARARHIAAIAAKYGFAALLDRGNQASAETRRQTIEAEGAALAPDERQDLAARVVSMLEELGPTFVKFGQILSTRPDLIPPNLAMRLQTLQDGVAPVPFAQVRECIEESLGHPPEELFATFESDPIASASIAQVHGAMTHKGEDIVVKVQRPHIRRTIQADLSLLNFIAAQVLDVFPEAELFDLEGMVSEFEKSLMRELDFEVEQKSLMRFAENFAEKPRIHIPRVFPEFSGKTVLTMERVRGNKLTQLDDDVDASEVAELYLDAAYQMLFQDGFFHGDLHPGNVFLEDDGRLGIIDFGMVGRLSKSMRERVVDIIFSVLREDLEAVARIWYTLGKPTQRVDYAVFEADVVEILERYAIGRPMEEIDIGAFLRELAAGAVRHRIQLPSDFTMMFKAMVTTEGLAKQVAKGIQPVEAARPYIQALIQDRYNLDRLKSSALADLIHGADIARQIPSRIDRLLSQAEGGDLELRLTHLHLEPVARRITRAFNRMSVAMVAASASLTGALTIDHGERVLLGLSGVSLFAFSIAALAGVWLGFGILRGR